jgi:serine beta-lactamase-like protein LACTB
MNRHSVARWVFLLCMLTSTPLAAQTAGGLPAATIEKVQAAISSEMARQGIPGLSVAIVTDHRLRWSNGYGLADLENFVPATPATVYRLGSISKTITAVATMQLVEKGKLDLDAPVQKYVPSFPAKPWPITTRQLLGHLSGIRHYQRDEIDSTRHYARLLDGLAIFRNDPLLDEPGAKFHYTTYGYTLLGCVLESAAGMSYGEYVRDNIFQPAGMDTIRVDDVFAIIPHRAQGYQKMRSGELRNSGLADTSYKVPGGGLCSTVEDLAKFAIAVQRGRLVKPETLAQMFTAQKTRGGQSTGYGLGWGIGERAGRKEVMHGGGQQRISTFLYMLPEERCAVVLMTNLEDAGLADLARKIADLALQRPGTGTP